MKTMTALLKAALFTTVIIAISSAVIAIHGASAHGDKQVKGIFSGKLPNVPGKTLSAVLVNYGPGESTPAHHHAGTVFAYVLSGAIRSENSATGPTKVYK